MAVCVSTDQYIYLIGGRHFGGSLTDGKLYNDILRYDIDTDQWTLAGTTAETGENRFAFTIEGVAFVGGGENDNTGILNTFYRIED
jgi:N-acetylneuraminic acid mutarotase